MGWGSVLSGNRGIRGTSWGLSCLPFPRRLHQVPSVRLTSSSHWGRDPAATPRVACYHSVDDRGCLTPSTLFTRHLPVTWEGWGGAEHPLTEAGLSVHGGRATSHGPAWFGGTLLSIGGSVITSVPSLREEAELPRFMTRKFLKGQSVWDSPGRRWELHRDRYLRESEHPGSRG